MLLYEIQNNEQNPRIPLEGSRTLLKLHRALKFTQLFLNSLAVMNDTDNLPATAITIYNNTLANFHPWLIRNAAKLAMYTLPNKKALINNISKEADFEQITEKLKEGAAALEEVYTGIELLYTQNDLHSLN